MSTYFNDIPHPKTIIHIDIDCFYAQVEMILDPSLRHKPVGVQQKNILVTSNYKAREMGLRKCMYIKDAVRQLPSLVLVDGSDLTNYRKFSTDICELLQSYTGLVEKLGFDEHFLDVSDIIEEDTCNEIVGKTYGSISPENVVCACGCFERMKAGSILAKQLRVHILQSTGLTCCAGIAHNKLIAKLACSLNKPNNQTIVFPWQAIDLMTSLPSAKLIPGIGGVTFKGLNRLGVFTVVDLQKVSVSTLTQHFSQKVSESLIGLAYGEDPSTVRQLGPPTTLGVEESFLKVDCASEVQKQFLVLAKRLLSLHGVDNNRIPGCIKVTVRKFAHGQVNKYQRQTKQVPISISIFLNADELKKIEYLSTLAFNTFAKMVDHKKPFHLTLLGLGFTKFESTPATPEASVNFFKRLKSEGQLKRVCEGANYNPTPVSSSPAGSIVANEISVKDICANFRDGIRLHGDSSPGSKSPYSFSKKSCSFPPYIDRSVFDTLPPSIQNDILSDYSNQHVPNNISPGKKNCMKQTKVSDFFTKI